MTDAAVESSSICVAVFIGQADEGTKWSPKEESIGATVEKYTVTCNFSPNWSRRMELVPLSILKKVSASYGEMVPGYQEH